MATLLLGAMAAAPAHADDPPWIVRAKSGLVASDSEYASRAGLEMLEAGGNAIDAAVATSFALAVTRPYSTGLGGGGFMIARFADGRVVVQDFRETAPAAATHDMFINAAGLKPDGPRPSVVGGPAVGVPGLVAGRCQALEQYGTMSLARTLQPAIRLTVAGFAVDTHYIDNAEDALKLFERFPSLKETCAYVYHTHLGSGKLPEVGAMLYQPRLTRLFEELAQYGSDFFYHGPVAEAMVETMKAHGGLITRQDLRNYKVREREPIRSPYRQYELILMPPPSSGGIAIAQTLNILEAFPLPAIFKSDPGLAVHYQIEAVKHAMADRARYLGDADFADVPADRLISEQYAAAIAKRLMPSSCARLESYGSPQLPDDDGTSHFCVVDRHGNVVVSSETINTAFGSLVAVDEWGLILNNEMDDFASEPGRPNAYALVQSEANAIAPRKRPLSSMSPTIVLKDGKPWMLLGGSGGPRIITSVLNVLLGVTDFGLDLEEAMTRIRPHHQWKPDSVFFDSEPPDHLREALTRRGHKLSEKRKKGVIQAILRDGETWIGASDPRKGGRPAGY